MSESSQSTPPYRIVWSERCRQTTRELLLRAAQKGRQAEVAQLLRDIIRRLEWIPLDFGEPLVDHVHAGIQERIAPLAPLVVRFGVDEVRRLVYVLTPLKLLSNSGL